VSDGTGYWRLRQNRWSRYDPATGEVTAGEPPEFFADGGVTGDLVPAPPEWAGSPLGHAGGLVGWRVRENADGSRVLTRVDGREVVFPASRTGYQQPVAGLQFPGTDRLCPVTADSTGPGQRGFTVLTPDGDQTLTSDVPRATLPPTDWWHAWQVRDAAGSAALRGIG